MEGAITARVDGRQTDELRAVRITPGALDYAEGSALIEQGETRVLCAASVEERVPSWRQGAKSGWVTAEYAMLPRATITRTPRERSQGRATARSLEIERLIGRSLRAILPRSFQPPGYIISTTPIPSSCNPFSIVRAVRSHSNNRLCMIASVSAFSTGQASKKEEKLFAKSNR